MNAGKGFSSLGLFISFPPAEDAARTTKDEVEKERFGAALSSLCFAGVCPCLVLSYRPQFGWVKSACICLKFSFLCLCPCLCLGGYLYQKRRNLRVLFRDEFDENDEMRKCYDLSLSCCCFPSIIVQHEIIYEQHGYSFLSLSDIPCFYSSVGGTKRPLGLPTFDSSIADDLRLHNTEDRAVLRRADPDCAQVCLRLGLGLKHFPYASLCCSCCPLPKTNPAACSPLRVTTRRVLLLGPANCGKSVLQQKLLLDCAPPSSPHLRSSPYTVPESEIDLISQQGDPTRSVQPPHIRYGFIPVKVGLASLTQQLDCLEVIDVPYGELTRHLTLEDSTLLDNILPKAQACVWCFDGSDPTGTSFEELRSLYEHDKLEPAEGARGRLNVFVALKMDLVLATGTVKDLFERDSLGRGVAAEGEREKSIAFILRKAAEWTAEQGAVLMEVSSFKHSGISQLREFLVSELFPFL